MPNDTIVRPSVGMGPGVGGGYRLQIVDPYDRVILRWPAGDPLEADLVQMAVREAQREGIGLFRTEAQVSAALRVGLQRAIHALKTQVRPTRPE